MMKDTCPECGSEDLITDYERAEVVCGRCGLVIDEFIQNEGYGFNECNYSQMCRNRVIEDSTTFTLHDKGLSTVIDERNADSHGEKIPTRNRNQLYRLRKWERRTKVSDHHERNLAKALNEIDKYGSTIGFSRDMKEDASITYRNALDYKLVSGRGIHKIVAACLYITCRRFNTPRTLDEIGNITGISKREIGRTYRFLSRELNIKLPLISPADYVPRYASKLGLSGEIEAKAIEIIEKARKKGPIPGQPKNIAVAALYISSDSFGEKILIKDLTKITGVTRQSLKNRSDELIQFLY